MATEVSEAGENESEATALVLIMTSGVHFDPEALGVLTGTVVGKHEIRFDGTPAISANTQERT